MKLLIPAIASLTLLVACAGKQEKTDNRSVSAPANQSAAVNAEEPDRVIANATPATKGDEKTDSKPVAFTCLGIAPDKEHIAYKIKVNTDKKISQVDIELKYTDDKGKVETETIIWQNIVKSTSQPIEKGKTYEDQSYLSPGATKVECKLLRVIFQDNTVWNAQ